MISACNFATLPCSAGVSLSFSGHFLVVVNCGRYVPEERPNEFSALFLVFVDAHIDCVGTLTLCAARDRLSYFSATGYADESRRLAEVELV